MPKACWVVQTVDEVALTGWEDVYAGEFGAVSGHGVSPDSISPRGRIGYAGGKGAFEGVGSMPVLKRPRLGLSSGLSLVLIGINPPSNSSGESITCVRPACWTSASSSSF